MVACLKKKKKTNTKLAVILTDYASHRFWEMKTEFVNLYFVANEEMKYSLIHSGIDEKKIHVTGIPIRPEFLKSHDRKALLEEFAEIGIGVVHGLGNVLHGQLLHVMPVDEAGNILPDQGQPNTFGDVS